MSWQLLLAITTTLPALLIAAVLVALILVRRDRIYRMQKAAYLSGPRHIDHPKCRCHICNQQRLRQGAQF